MQISSLNNRIVLFTIAVVTVTSVVFAFGILTLKNQLEEATFGRMVRDQLNYILNNPGEFDKSNLQLLPGWTLTNNETVTRLAAEIRDLSPGSHHSVRVGNAYYQVEVATQGDDIYYLTYDISEWEEQEHQLLGLLVYGFILLLAIAAIGAVFTAKASLKPLHSFTRRLSMVQPDQRSLRIANEFSGDEVHLIAIEFDRYLKRLDEFVEREQFITAAASHELRTPLAVIMGAIDVIESNSVELKNDKALSRIKRACDEMLAFIEATLFLSREDSNPIQSERTTNLHKLLTEIENDMKEEIANKKISFVNKVPADFEVNQQVSVLKMIIGNIVRNAIEHTEEGYIEVYVKGRSLAIQDTGEGISEDSLQRVFERSFTTKKTGFGMGLTLAKKLCDRLGWTLELDSKLNLGTLVTIHFNQ